MKKYYDTVIDSQGNAVSGASVVVTSYPSDGAVSIYLVNNTASPVAASTLTTDVTGFFYFYAPDGQYILKIYDASGNLQRTIADVQIVDDAWQNGVAISSTPPTPGQVLTADTSATASWHTVTAALTGFTGASNTGLGVSAGTSIAAGVRNVVVGVGAGGAVTDAADCTLIGYGAGAGLTTSSNGATAIGKGAGAQATGSFIAIGSGALSGTGSGTSLVAIGFSALAGNMGGQSDCVAVGDTALNSCTNGSNIGIGSSAGRSITSGSQNVCIGTQAGQTGTAIVGGSKNTLLGDSTSVDSASADRRTAIGYNAQCKVNNGIQLGTSTESVLAGAGPLATNATFGYLYIPTCAGPPTGTPTSVTGMAPLIIDTTNSKLYFFAGSWRLVTST